MMRAFLTAAAAVMLAAGLASAQTAPTTGADEVGFNPQPDPPETMYTNDQLRAASAWYAERGDASEAATLRAASEVSGSDGGVGDASGAGRVSNMEIQSPRIGSEVSNMEIQRLMSEYNAAQALLNQSEPTPRRSRDR